MPQFGDHYALPEPPKPSSPGAKTSPYSRSEERQVADLLKHNLGPEFISKRPSPGGRSVHYLEGWKVFNLANEIFGFNGWRSEIRKLEVDYCDKNPDTKRWDVGVVAIVRVHLKDGTFREDTGSGNMENCPKRDMALNKSRKEAVTDAFKRAMRQFGPSLGNCLYDSEYLSKLKSVKMAKYTLDEGKLIRKPEFVIKKNIKEEEPVRPSPPQMAAPSVAAPQAVASKPIVLASAPVMAAPKAPNTVNDKAVSIEAMCEGVEYSFDDDDLDLDDLVPQLRASRTSTPPVDEAKVTQPSAVESQPTPVGFYKASVATDINKGSPVAREAVFDINIQSPSMKRTLEHNRSVPVSKPGVRAPMYAKSTNIPASPLAKIPAQDLKSEATTPVAKKHKAVE